MPIDLSKLSPAPWTANSFGEVYDPEGRVADCGFVEDAEFIALARNAFDVMMRRGWIPTRWLSVSGKWGVFTDTGDGVPLELQKWPDDAWPDPFTALVEADRWLTAREQPPAAPPAAVP